MFPQFLNGLHLGWNLNWVKTVVRHFALWSLWLCVSTLLHRLLTETVSQDPKWQLTGSQQRNRLSFRSHTLKITRKRRSFQQKSRYWWVINICFMEISPDRLLNGLGLRKELPPLLYRGKSWNIKTHQTTLGVTGPRLLTLPLTKQWKQSCRFIHAAATWTVLAFRCMKRLEVCLI